MHAECPQSCELNPSNSQFRSDKKVLCPERALGLSPGLNGTKLRN